MAEPDVGTQLNFISQGVEKTAVFRGSRLFGSAIVTVGTSSTAYESPYW
jgi:hypothetical protein